MFLDFVITAILLAAISGLPGLFGARMSSRGERLAATLMTCAMIVGCIGAGGGLFIASEHTRLFPWPAMGNGVLGLDPLSAFFLIPVFLLGGLGAIYGLGYWPQRRHPRTGCRLCVFWGLLTAGMGLLLISRQAMAFLLGWEIMALSAYFLIVTETQHVENRKAGWIYLIATHVSTLTLFALFALWRHFTGSYDFLPAEPGVLTSGIAHLFFVLGLVGFGIKAGMIPLHFWLPDAHATAPSHVSAMMSGVVLKMGVYGMVRWLSLLPGQPPAIWGGTIITLGAISALLGIVFAIGQHDIKRLLAYCSVENIGIILMGLGVALLGRSYDRPEWVVLGLAGCLLHVWNHSLFKSLLFFCAGAVIHSSHTRQIDRMGGLAKTMPQTALYFLIGSVAICGLPPLNGFVSEWFIYLGMLRSAIPEPAAGIGALIGVPVLAMIGALAVLCFVKLYGTAFLGEPRTATAKTPHEAPFTMRLPMAILVAGCVLIGLAPALVAHVLEAPIACWLGQSHVTPIAAVVPLNVLSVIAGGLTLSLAGALWYGRRWQVRARKGPTWDCGYAQPTPRMQYTSSSFAQMIVLLFKGVLRPRKTATYVTGIFPVPTHTHSHVDDAVLHRMLLPAGRKIANGFGWFHRFQRGQVQYYMLYILVTVIVLLIWSVIRG